MSTPAMTYQQAIRAAGATSRFGILHHCGRPMTAGAGLRHTCQTCQITIERADSVMPANPAPGREDELWIITQRTQ